jgi:hypothetical protein
MRTLTLSLLLCTPLTALAQPIVPPRQGKSEKIELFNGKDIDNWDGNKNLWSVKDGVIVGKNMNEVKVSTYLLTKRKFSDFHLVFSGKLVESELHSGAKWRRTAATPSPTRAIWSCFRAVGDFTTSMVGPD